MSGAEATAVLGVIASVISLIDATKKIYDAATDIKGLPEAFREVTGRLPIVRDILELAKGHITGLDRDSCKAVKDVIDACEQKSLKLEKLFENTIPGESSSRLERYYKAVRSLGKGNAVENLMKGILLDTQLLARNHGMQVITKVQEDEVAQAITAMSETAISVPEQIFYDPAVSVEQSGSGTQNNAWGGNIAQGEARQYNSGGGPMHIGKD